MATQTITAPTEKPDPAPKPQVKLEDVINFLARYLYCTGDYVRLPDCRCKHELNSS